MAAPVNERLDHLVADMFYSFQMNLIIVESVYSNWSLGYGRHAN